MTAGLKEFHPLVRTWFADTLGAPTDVQTSAWPAIARGEHLLVTAPTGSGKTLTAFLWAVNQLVAGAWTGGQVRVLYVSPLKALNTDIRQNLMRPLAQIRERFEAEGQAPAEVRVLTRSGDTPQKDRRKMSIHPPEILITTPESLNLLLSSVSGCHILTGLKTVILDEIHACAGSKRGVHMITAVDRLVRLSGEFQRIALSATLGNPESVAGMVGGYTLSGSPHAPEYTPRQVTCISSKIAKDYNLQVCFPERPKPSDIKDEDDYSVWDLLAGAFTDRIRQNRSTLIFSNGRRACEKLTYKVNRAAGELTAWSHHGSLSKDLRKDVEARLRSGGLKAIVATSSLEMGIDIGDLDEVIMVQPPFSVSSAVQRLGRAGHRVGETSAGRLFPAHVQELIPSAVLARAVREGDIEPLTPVKAPLDVLAQILISMTAMETWDLDELYAFIRTSAPYRNLSRQQFDLTIQMLAGRYARTRVRDLSPRISVDRTDNTVAAKKGALLALYMSGGTIPDRGYYQLRHAKTNARIGELDEEYVWEAKVGQIATVGTQNWKITRITHNDVFALPAGNRGMDAPFWRAEDMNRDFHFSDRMARFLEEIDSRLKEGKAGRDALKKELTSACCMDETGADELIAFCRSQAEAAVIPHRHRIVLEYVRSGPGSAPGTMLVIHTLWGGRVNRPFALALAAAWQQHFNVRPEIFPGNDAVVVQLPDPVSPEELLCLVTPETCDHLIRQQLESSGFFGARFRECAGRALLVTRNRINQRMPLWMTRLSSQRLMENIIGFPDFPILLETWRTCLKDAFDMPALAEVLGELSRGEITWREVHTATPSPFAGAMAWQQINQYMYQEDQPASAKSGLLDDLITSALYSSELRPKISKATVAAFERKRQRLAPGYAPDTSRDLTDWVKERVVIPMGEWEDLTKVLRKETDRIEEHADDLIHTAGDRLVVLNVGDGLVAAGETISDLLESWYRPGNLPAVSDMAGRQWEPAAADGDDKKADTGLALFAQWLSFYGPKSLPFCRDALGLDDALLDGFISDMTETGALVTGTLCLDAEDTREICDARNLEILIRMHRAAGRPDMDPLDTELLPLFLADCQGLLRTPNGGDSLDTLFDTLEGLACLPLPAGLWESDILPARLPRYHPSFLDSLMQEGEILWLGREKGRIMFCFEPDLAFLTGDNLTGDKRDDTPGENKDPDWDGIFRDTGAGHDFLTLQTLTGLSSQALSDRIWNAVWQGHLTNTTFLALRKGIENRFTLPKTLDAGNSSSRHRRRSTRGGRRAGMLQGPGLSRTALARRQGTLPMAGAWFKPEFPEPEGDLVALDELNRDRVRVLLDRYGILFRELLARELPGFRWGDLFRTLYLMELSGEVKAGSFFKGILGPQFISHKALRKLQAGPGTGRDAVYWMNAADPASLCGISPQTLGLGLPKRLPATRLVYHGTDLVLISRRSGKEMTITVDPDDAHLPRYLTAVEQMMTRPSRPATRVSVETINGADAAASPYRNVLEEIFEVAAGLKSLDLYVRRNHDGE
ncbi:MAG TPA: ATP-dependent helicase [Desulfobacteraceae bacterium]|nr:ATP-dependent helicase [Desulfobacteraceae bacterium]